MIKKKKIFQNEKKYFLLFGPHFYIYTTKFQRPKLESWFIDKPLLACWRKYVYLLIGRPQSKTSLTVPEVSCMYGRAVSPEGSCLYFPLFWGAAFTRAVTRRTTWHNEHSYQGTSKGCLGIKSMQIWPMKCLMYGTTQSCSNYVHMDVNRGVKTQGFTVTSWIGLIS